MEPRKKFTRFDLTLLLSTFISVSMIAHFEAIDHPEWIAFSISLGVYAIYRLGKFIQKKHHHVS